VLRSKDSRDLQHGPVLFEKKLRGVMNSGFVKCKHGFGTVRIESPSQPGYFVDSAQACRLCDGKAAGIPYKPGAPAPGLKKEPQEQESES